MKSIVAILGLAIMFASIPPRAKPQSAAPAGSVLFVEGQASEASPTPAAETDLETVAVTPAPVLIDVQQMERLVEKIAEAAAKSVVPAQQKPSAELAKAAADSRNPAERIAEQAAALDPGWVKAVYPVRVTGISTDPRSRGMTATAGGTAIAVGPGKLHTAKHLADRLAGYVAEVQVGGKWVRAAWSPSPSKDLAVLTLSGVELDPVPVRVPEYGEPVTVYGLSTKSFAQGRYIGDLNPAIGNGEVTLEPAEAVTEEGDSGGGVFSDDGYLLGTLTGKSEAETRVAFMVPIVADAPAVQSSVAAPPARTVQSCPGGVCPVPSAQQQPTQWFTPRRSRRN